MPASPIEKTCFEKFQARCDNRFYRRSYQTQAVMVVVHLTFRIDALSNALWEMKIRNTWTNSDRLSCTHYFRGDCCDWQRATTINWDQFSTKGKKHYAERVATTLLVLFTSSRQACRSSPQKAISVFFGGQYVAGHAALVVHPSLPRQALWPAFRLSKERKSQEWALPRRAWAREKICWKYDAATMNA